MTNPPSVTVSGVSRGVADEAVAPGIHLAYISKVGSQLKKIFLGKDNYEAFKNQDS